MGCALAIVFRSAPSTFPQRRGYLLGTCFRESLVIRLHSEIGQIHLSIEAQCGPPVYLWVTTTTRDMIMSQFALKQCNKLNLYMDLYGSVSVLKIQPYWIAWHIFAACIYYIEERSCQFNVGCGIPSGQFWELELVKLFYIIHLKKKKKKVKTIALFISWKRRKDSKKETPQSTRDYFLTP